MFIIMSEVMPHTGSSIIWLGTLNTLAACAHQSRRSPIAFGRVGPRSLQPLQPASPATDNDMASAAPGQPYWGTTEVYDMHDGYSRLLSPSAGWYSLFFVRVTLVAGRLDSLTPFAEASDGFKTLSDFIFSSFFENSCGLDSHCSRTGRVLQGWRQLYDRMERG